MSFETAQNVADINGSVHKMLKLFFNFLEVCNVHNDRISDVLKLFGTNIDNSFVVDSFQLNVNVSEAFVILQVGVLEVDLVTALKKFIQLKCFLKDFKNF